MEALRSFLLALRKRFETSFDNDRYCPDCNNQLFAVTDLDQINFHCKECGGCWAFWEDTPVPVDPSNCVGCELVGDCRYLSDFRVGERIAVAV